MNFEIGQKVVCIKPIDGLIKGNEYIVLGLGVCSHCGAGWIDVGDIVGEYIKCLCIKCEMGDFPSLGHIRWYDYSRFSPLKYETIHDEILEKFKAPAESPDVPEKILTP